MPFRATDRHPCYNFAMTPSDAQDIEPPLVLAIDAGSSSTRALLLDRQGNQLEGSLSRRAVHMHITPDGGVEDNPQRALQRIVFCIDATLAARGVLVNQIGAVVLTTYASSILGITADGQPLTPIYLYADTRNTSDAATLRRQFDERMILNHTGCPLRTPYLPSRLHWLQRTQPDVAIRVWRWVSLGEYVLLHFFGQTHVSLSVASWSGLLDRHRLTWDDQLLCALRLDTAHLSPIVDTYVTLTGLRAPYAQRWPVLNHVPWFPPCSDGAAANVGSGCMSPDRVALTVGTTAAMRAIVSAPIEHVPWGLWCYRVDRQRALPGGATSEGGNLFAWLRHLLRLSGAARLEQALMAYEPDSHGLTILPFVAGERSPGWAGDVRASILGLSLHTTATDILRAALEAVAYRLALIMHLLDQVCPVEQNQRTIIASGGALRSSPAWVQLLADVLGQPVVLLAAQEESSRGAALLALESLGLVPELATEPLQFAHLFAPDMAHHARYREAMARQQRLYTILIGNQQEEDYA